MTTVRVRVIVEVEDHRGEVVASASSSQEALIGDNPKFIHEAYQRAATPAAAQVYDMVVARFGKPGDGR